MSTVCETGFINIVDAFLNPDGTAWTGAITYTLQYATTAAGATLIQARQNINVSDGIDICLAPGLYTVVYNQSGQRLPVTSQWTVPPVGGPYTIADIEGATGAITTSLTVSGAFSALGSVTMASLVNASARPYVTTDANGLLGTSNIAAVATSGSASDLSTGTLAEARGGAGTINGILTADGTGLVSAASTTGTGSIVLATAPTFPSGITVSGVIGAGTVTAPVGTNLAFNAGTGSNSAATFSLGNGNNGAVILTPGQPTGGEYFTVAASSLASTAPTQDPFGTVLRFTINGPMNGHAAAGWFHTIIASTNANSFADYITGAYPYVRFDGSGVASTLVGTHSTVTMSGSGGHADVVDVYNTEFKLSSGTNYATTVNLFHGVVPLNVSGATSPTTLRGLLIDDLGSDGGFATNVYAIQTLGNSKCSFAGAVTVGSLTTGGVVTLTNATNSGSQATGAVIMSGGLGVAKTIWANQLSFPASGSTSAVGITFGTSSEALFRVSAGNMRLTCGAAFSVDADIIPVTSAQNDLGNSTFKWKNLTISATASVRNLLITAPTVPSSASDTGITGQFAWASGFLYICVATNTWQRVAVATW